MNDLQKCEYEILKEFISICDKLGLEYFLVCGSALGAVKYGGFIPWDDDMDVALRREDYEVFIKEAPKYLPDHLFLQNSDSDPEYPNIYSKLRNSKTTFIEKSSARLNINHGVYIDVFPLDGYPKTEKEQKKLELKKFICKMKQLSSFDGTYSFKVRVMWRVFRIFGVHKRISKTVKQYSKLISAYPTKDSSVWCNHGNWQGKLEYAPRQQYGSGIMMKFEGLDVRVPEKYDDYLTQKYGDWRAELPIEEQVGHHYYSIMDLNKSYTEYLK